MNRLCATVALLAVLLGPAASRATDGDLAALQTLHDEAGRLFDEGRFDEALAKYQACLDGGLPRELLYLIGRCHQEMERWAEARDAFREYLAGETSNPEAVGRAKLALRMVEERLATGTLLLAVTPFGAVVLLDGAEVGQAPLAPLDVAPGPHSLRVEAEGHEPAVREVTVEGGGRTQLTVELTAATTAPEAEAAAPTRYSPWTWVTLGSGLALLAGGTTSYLLGWKDHDDIAGADGDLTMRRALDLEASGDTKKVVGYALWGFGGACVATSAVLFILEATAPDVDAAVHVGFAPAPAGGGGLFSLGGEF